MSEKVQAYVTKLEEWVEKRDSKNLSNEESDAYLNELDVLWDALSTDEEDMATAIRREHKRLAAKRDPG